MGVDFAAIIEHHFTAGDLATVAEPLKAVEASVRALEEHLEFPPEPWTSSFPPKGSDLGGRFRERLLMYVRCGGIGLAVGHCTMIVHHICRWCHFASASGTTQRLRALCRDLVQWADGDRAVYLPDAFVVEAFDVAFEGMSMDDALRELLNTSGPPAATIRETVVEASGGGPCRYLYFVEYFGDPHKPPEVAGAEP